MRLERALNRALFGSQYGIIKNYDQGFMGYTTTHRCTTPARLPLDYASLGLMKAKLTASRGQ